MSERVITVGAAQMGPIAASESRADVVERLLAHMREAHRRGCDLVVYPELTLTTFFSALVHRRSGRDRQMV
jgi:predicted amidohydrolase